MKKNGLTILLIIIIAVIGYFTWINNTSSKDFKEQLTKIETNYQYKLDSTKAIIDVLRDSITKDKLVSENLQKSGDSAQRIANTLRKSLNQLRREKPETKDGLIENLLAQNKLLERENKKLREVIQKRDSVIIIQGSTINRLETIIVNKDIQFEQLDTLRLKTVKLYEKDAKRQRNKGRAEGGIGVLGIILLILLL